MKIKVFIFTLLLLYQFSFSQKDFKLDIDCFLLGMFDDYNGREIPLKHPFESTRINSFYCTEKKLKIIFVDSIKNNYSLSDLEVKYNTVYSKSLSKRLNKYYNINKDKDGGFIIDDIDYSSYIMKLKRSSFLSNKKKVSFILGAFLRYGKIKNDRFEIDMANSLSHFDILVWSMKELGFKYKDEIPCPKCIPVGQIVNFEPTEDYIKLFKNIKPFELDESDCNEKGL
ncbi:hypothetical protein [Flavobacterium capsici]|uniref:Uncharacterized protein n=1 Tax=Flavobacterium capsici TaxID=3075618 RepID=A0AA96EYM8_9FLAO|nr:MULTISPECIES: hypothetical protein [unclassified Flavobacterium]WNM18026.1 hypothetical protein RN608_08370 [Flavobacterium sp. PMR2A8]WNM22078.1 hypothetical protein RN605_01670 [Flavobacterium sp. PMTSA4]